MRKLHLLKTLFLPRLQFSALASCLFSVICFFPLCLIFTKESNNENALVIHHSLVKASSRLCCCFSPSTSLLLDVVGVNLFFFFLVLAAGFKASATFRLCQRSTLITWVPLMCEQTNPLFFLKAGIKSALFSTKHFFLAVLM